jgi:hypothetical protein
MTSRAPPPACYDWATTFSLHPRRADSAPPGLQSQVVIDYEDLAKIHDCDERQGLTIAQTARVLGLRPQTVGRNPQAAKSSRVFRYRLASCRPSILGWTRAALLVCLANRCSASQCLFGLRSSASDDTREDCCKNQHDN